jgi:hypothetical protein
MEFATGSDPTTKDSDSLPEESIVTIDSQNFLALTFRRLINAGNLVYEVQASNDMLGWNEGPGFVTPVGSPVDNGDGTQSLTFRSSLPASPDSTQFLRLQVTKP